MLKLFVLKFSYILNYVPVTRKYSKVTLTQPLFIIKYYFGALITKVTSQF